MDDFLRELQDDLRDVRPSPEFAAKVRRQLETQPARNWFGIWQVATAAAVVAVAVAALVLWRPQTRVTNSPVQNTVAVTQPAPRPTPPAATQTTVAQPVASGQVVVNRTAPRTTPAEPEVLVPSDQRMALVALLEGMRRRGNHVPSETTPLVDDEGRLPAPAEITVSPITIEPLSPPVPGGGSRERR
jgi:hypothetical protein